MTDRMKKVLERTEETLCRHLEDLNDQVEQDGGRIKDHMTLDGIKDSMKSVKDYCEIMQMADNGKGESASKSTATVTTVKQ